MADVPEPESPKAAANRQGVRQLRIWGLSLLAAALLLLVMGRRNQALGFGIVGALLAVAGFIGARLGGEKRSLRDRIELVVAVFLTCAAVLGSVLALVSYRERHKAGNDAKTKAMAARVEAERNARLDAGPPAERRCRILEGKTVSATLEADGGATSVQRGASCVVLDVGPSRTLIRVTDGPSAGAVGWLANEEIGNVREKLR